MSTHMFMNMSTHRRGDLIVLIKGGGEGAPFNLPRDAHVRAWEHELVYILMVYTAMTFIVMADIAVAHMVMAYIGITYIVMA